jgi:hypothetical protein
VISGVKQTIIKNKNNGDVTLYAHPELLDEAPMLFLLHPKTTATANAAPETTINKKQPIEKQYDNDDAQSLVSRQKSRRPSPQPPLLIVV